MGNLTYHSLSPCYLVIWCFYIGIIRSSFSWRMFFFPFLDSAFAYGNGRIQTSSSWCFFFLQKEDCHLLVDMFESDFECCTGGYPSFLPSFLWQHLNHPKIENSVWGESEQKVKVCDVQFLKSIKVQKAHENGCKLLVPLFLCASSSERALTDAWTLLLFPHSDIFLTGLRLAGWDCPKIEQCLSRYKFCFSSKLFKPFYLMIYWGMIMLQMGHGGKNEWVTDALMPFGINKY